MALHHFSQAIWRRRRLALAVLAGAMAASAVATVAYQPVYPATSKVMLAYDDPAQAVLPGTPRASSPAQTAAQLEVARSPALMTQVIKQLGLRDPRTRAPLTLDQFAGRGHVTSLPGTDVLAFTYREADPARARLVANSWARAFVAENRIQGERAADAHAHLLHEQQASARAELAQAEAILAAYQRTRAAVDPAEAARASALTESSLESALWQTTAAFEEATARQRVLQQQLDEQNGGVTDLAVDRAALTQAAMGIQVAAAGYEHRMATLERLLGSFRQRLKGLPEQARQLAQFKRHVTHASDRVQLVQRGLSEARLRTAVHVGNARVIAWATQPDKTDPASRWGWWLASLPLALLLALVAAWLRDDADGTLKTITEAELALGLNVLGVVPPLPASARAGLVVLSRPRHRASEAFRALRTRLGHLHKPLQVVAFTSAGPGEGQSAAIANLAVCTAQLGYRVLLVDADMRWPSLHRRFGLANQRGLSSVLSGDSSLRRAIADGPVDSLSVLTAGPTPENPADWLASPRMSALLLTLRAEYDLILIDMPPVLAVPDAAILAGRMDGFVFVVGMHRATPEGARLALQHLEATHGHVLGMALTGLTVTPDRPLDDATGPDPDDVTPTPATPLLRLPAPGPG